MRQLVTFISFFLSSSCWGLSCGPLSSSEVIASELVHHIFSTRVTSAKIEGDYVVANFDLEETFKGSPEVLKNVSTRYSSEGTLGIVVGKKYFFIVGNKGQYNICSGTGLMDWSDYSNVSVQEHFEYEDFYKELMQYYRAYNKRIKQRDT